MRWIPRIRQLLGTLYKGIAQAQNGELTIYSAAAQALQSGARPVKRMRQAIDRASDKAHDRLDNLPWVGQRVSNSIDSLRDWLVDTLDVHHIRLVRHTSERLSRLVLRLTAPIPIVSSLAKHAVNRAKTALDDYDNDKLPNHD